MGSLLEGGHYRGQIGSQGAGGVDVPVVDVNRSTMTAVSQQNCFSLHVRGNIWGRVKIGRAHV